MLEILCALLGDAGCLSQCLVDGYVNGYCEQGQCICDGN